MKAFDILAHITLLPDHYTDLIGPPPDCLIRGFHKHTTLANIGIKGIICEKKSSDKMLPLVGIELGPLIASDSKSNTILSTLT